MLRRYDVWLGNSRGNHFSRNHTKLSVNSKAFWNFTFNDMSLDIAAVVPYALDTSNVSTLSYVGWSQANTAMLIAGIIPDIASMLKQRVSLWVALSPVSYLSHSTSTILSTLSRLRIGTALQYLYPYGILDDPKDLDAFQTILCKLTLGAVCSVTVAAMCGYSPFDDATAIEAISSHFPAGTSVKDMVHYEQFMNRPVFERYDYGARLNQEYYHQTEPPSYDLSKYKGPKVALFAAGNDALVAEADYNLLRQQLGQAPGGAIAFNKTYPGFSHLTWLVGNGQTATWLTDLDTLIKQNLP